MDDLKVVKSLVEVLQLSQVELLDVQKAGAVIVKVPETSEEIFIEVCQKITAWGQSLGINVITLPMEMKVEIIPHDLVTKPIAYSIIEKLEEKVSELEKKVKELSCDQLFFNLPKEIV